MLMLVGISTFIPYQPGINIEIKVAQTADGILHYSSQIPESAMKKRLQFTEVQLNPSADLPLPTRFQIESISDVVQFTGNDAWQRAVLNPVERPEKNVLLQNPINVPGKILLEKQSVMMWVVGKVLCYNTPQKLDNKLRYDDERKTLSLTKKTYVHNKKKIQQRV
ncbi:hypothetical protein [Bacteroides pyogenes]|uniref:hypothetical protein n=1 Tax=Bacteroides pyogenes TaxID=310300 RepID=UPI001BABD423